MRVRMGPTIGTITRISRWRNCLEKARLTNLHSREVLSVADLLLSECNRNEDPEGNSISAPKPVHPSRDAIHLDWCAIRHKMKIPSPQQVPLDKPDPNGSGISLGHQLLRNSEEKYTNCIATALFQDGISNRLHVRKLIGVSIESFHRIDIPVNNARITRDRSIRKMTDEDWSEIIDTNLNSVSLAPAQQCPA